MAGLSVLSHMHTPLGSRSPHVGRIRRDPIFFHFFPFSHRDGCFISLHTSFGNFLMQRTGRVALPSRFCYMYFSFFMILGLGNFPHHQTSMLGSLKNGWKFPVCKSRFWIFLWVATLQVLWVCVYESISTLRVCYV